MKWLRNYWDSVRRGIVLTVDTLTGWNRSISEPIMANYKHGWLVTTKARDKVKIVCILNYQFEEVGEPLYFVQSKKTGVSYHLLESEIKPKEK